MDQFEQKIQALEKRAEELFPAFGKSCFQNAGGKEAVPEAARGLYEQIANIRAQQEVLRKEKAAEEAKPRCRYCGKPMPEDAVFCGHCGRKAEAEPAAPVSNELICPKCGKKLDEDSVFCFNCGTKVKEA